MSDGVGSIPRGDLLRLVAAIDPDATLVREWSMKGGIGNAMSAIEIARDGRPLERFVVRRPPEWALREDPATLTNEFALLRRLRARGIRCQAPRMLDDSKADAPYLVLEYIEGAPDFTAPPAVDFIDQFARSLAEIHRIDASGWGLADNTVKVERWWLRQREQYDESLQEQRILDALMAAWPWRPANEPTLLHGDYWPGNVLWRNGTLVGVIDWEEARRGDPLFDVAISRLDLAWAFGADAMRRFTETYVAASSVDVAALPYWDLLAALRPAHYISHWATPWPGYGRPDVTVATMRTTHRTFVEQAFVALARNRSR